MICGNNSIVCVCSVIQSCLILCDPMGCSPQAPLFRDFPGKDTGVCSNFILQEFFPTQESNYPAFHGFFTAKLLGKPGNNIIK